MNETRELMAPMKTITENLRTASANLVEIGVAARDQFRRVEAMVTDTGKVLHTHRDRLNGASQDVVERINETAAIVQDSVIRPVREVAALAKGVGRGFDTLF